MPVIPKYLGDGFESRPDRPQTFWGLEEKSYMAVGNRDPQDVSMS
jgi:hypothetical protein